MGTSFNIDPEAVERLGREASKKLAEDLQPGFDAFQATQAGRPLDEITESLIGYFATTPLRLDRRNVENIAAAIARSEHVQLRAEV